MVMWAYVPDRRLTAAQMRDMPKVKACLACGALVLRMAERGGGPFYAWTPNGWICSKCNLMYMGTP
jgi:hypothetical protein